VTVITGGKGVLSHVGTRLLCELADDLSLTGRLSVAITPTTRRRCSHDHGERLVDLVAALADGARSISDMRVHCDQPGLFGEVALLPTAWRTLEAID
jgi:hypothetical protein